MNHLLKSSIQAKIFLHDKKGAASVLRKTYNILYEREICVSFRYITLNNWMKKSTMQYADCKKVFVQYFI